MKHDINWYMNTAKELNGLKSDRKLAIELGLANIAPWRHPDRHNVPSVSSMIKLAKLANMPIETALVHRDMWEAEFNAPEAVPYFKKTLKLLQKTAAALILGIALLFANAGVDGGAQASTGQSLNSGGIYIMETFYICNLLIFQCFCENPYFHEYS
ncbi:hypothetical protein [Pseudemcibacter aquimaris]|uniref:hypothetical protein n=1 Tax=Pseudemcibacter aquimaris TaxID=2857064 RepID=UPI0020122C50|nr:hypothetical protein [Pseudemcibacter aquimaris]MCC3859761.1 hypothetical protein [Pseudemcibacter aquimaris]WDU60155.1 hypothetical protein KW060_07780 [Pseudemcibacter aquimaris]